MIPSIPTPSLSLVLLGSGLKTVVCRAGPRSKDQGQDGILHVYGVQRRVREYESTQGEYEEALSTDSLI